MEDITEQFDNKLEININERENTNDVNLANLIADSKLAQANVDLFSFWSESVIITKKEIVNLLKKKEIENNNLENDNKNGINNIDNTTTEISEEVKFNIASSRYSNSFMFILSSGSESKIGSIFQLDNYELDKEQILEIDEELEDYDEDQVDDTIKKEIKNDKINKIISEDFINQLFGERNNENLKFLTLLILSKLKYKFNFFIKNPKQSKILISLDFNLKKIIQQIGFKELVLEEVDISNKTIRVIIDLISDQIASTISDKSV